MQNAGLSLRVLANADRLSVANTNAVCKLSKSQERNANRRSGMTFVNKTTLTGSMADLDLVLRAIGAKQLPVKGFFEGYAGTQFSDTGVKQSVIVRSSRRLNDDGEVTWTESVFE